MSASPQNAPSTPKDNQERRLRLKREAIELGGELAAHGARVELGKITPLRAVLEVRQDKRDRQDVVVTIEDDAPVYTLAGGDEEMLDTLAVRRRVLSPPNRSTRWWWVAVSLVAWVLVAIGWAIYAGKVNWLLLAAIVVAGTVLTLAVGAAGASVRRARRRRNAILRLTKRR